VIVLIVAFPLTLPTIPVNANARTTIPINAITKLLSFAIFTSLLLLKITFLTLLINDSLIVEYKKITIYGRIKRKRNKII
jgi:hypothetical protein